MYFTLVVSLCCVLGVYSQIATIIDEDGFTNVRLKPNKQSEVIFKVEENRVFWLGEDYLNDTKEWKTVYVPKNMYSLTQNINNYLKGYIHRSRIKLLQEKKNYTDEIDFSYVTKPFDQNGKIVELFDDKFVKSINGLFIWGTDGGIPNYEIEKIDISINNVSVWIPEILKQDLYEKINEKSIKKYKIKDTYFVYHWNSDAAGHYEVVWVIENEILKQRLVGSIF